MPSLTNVFPQLATLQFGKIVRNMCSDTYRFSRLPRLLCSWQSESHSIARSWIEQRTNRTAIPSFFSTPSFGTRTIPKRNEAKLFERSLHRLEKRYYTRLHTIVVTLLLTPMSLLSGKRNHAAADQGSEMTTTATATKKEKKTRKIIPIPEDIKKIITGKQDGIDEEDSKVLQSIPKVIVDAGKKLDIRACHCHKDDKDCRIFMLQWKYYGAWDEAYWALMKKWILKLDALQFLEIDLLVPETVTPPPWIDELQNLKEFHFNERYCFGVNPDKMLTEKIGNLKNLESLTLAMVNCEFLPTTIGNLTNLKTLNIAFPLRSLPDEIGRLTNLKNLRLYNTSLKSLPAAIGSLTNLESIKICGDQPTNLRGLPDEIGNLTSLTYLRLYRCKISSLPSSIGNLSNLRELNLEKCGQLKALPDSMRNLNRLEILRLDGCNITFPSTVGRSMKNLRFLTLGDKHISNTTALQEFLQECPRVECLGRTIKKPCFRIETLETPLLRNQIRSRVTRPSATHPQSSFASYPLLSLWPLILVRAKRATYPSKFCLNRCFSGCRPRLNSYHLHPKWRTRDVIFCLLVDLGANIVPRNHQHHHEADANTIH